MAFFATLPSYGGGAMRLVRDQSLALIFLTGCAATALGIVSVFVRDLQQGAMSVLMSRPVSSLSLILGKWTGLIAAIFVYHATLTIACLWMTRILRDLGSSRIDSAGLFLYFASILVALGLMGLKHYFMGGWYVWQANIAILVIFSLSFVLNCFTAKEGWGSDVNWQCAMGSVFIFFSLILFSAVLFPFAIKGQTAFVFTAALIIFAVGMVSNYLVLSLNMPETISQCLKAVLPNWQIYWVSDKLAETHDLHAGGYMRYLGHTALHAVLYTIAALSVTTYLFNRREIYGAE
ncbi:MAG: hypothetical protein MJH11_21160 [Lentisphaeria bacterium]|nr:hypothetical protein [Lentisphaeria bacterium]